MHDSMQSIYVFMFVNNTKWKSTKFVSDICVLKSGTFKSEVMSNYLTILEIHSIKLKRKFIQFYVYMYYILHIHELYIR